VRSYLSNNLPSWPFNYLHDTEGKALKQQHQWETRARWKGKPPKVILRFLSDSPLLLHQAPLDLDNFDKLGLDALKIGPPRTSSFETSALCCSVDIPFSARLADVDVLANGTFAPH
jgi:hypothetical protein